MGYSKRLEREPDRALRPHLGDQQQDSGQSAASLRCLSLSRVSTVSCWKPHQWTIPNLITLFDTGLSSLKITFLFLLCLLNATLPSSCYECCKLATFGEQWETDNYPGHRLINGHVSLYATDRNAGFWRRLPWGCLPISEVPHPIRDASHPSP